MNYYWLSWPQDRGLAMCMEKADSLDEALSKHQTRTGKTRWQMNFVRPRPL